MNKKFTKLAAGLALAIGLGVTGAANAGALGMADLAITQLLLLKTNNTPLTGISIISDGRTGTASSNYNGVEGVGIGSGSISTNGGANADVKYRCAGDCSTASLEAIYGVGTVENNSTTHISTPSGNYALGDMFVSGSAIAGGSAGLTRANASANGPTNTGGANSTILNSVTATTTFTVNTAVDAYFSLSYDVFAKVFVDFQPGQSGSSSAGTGFIMTITSTDDPLFTPLVWLPTPLNNALSSSTSTDNAQFSAIGTTTSNVLNLHGGKRYNLTINQSSNSIVNVIPEPGTIALMGLGLLGVGASVRRRKA